MSKVIKHSRLAKIQKKKREHNHFTMGKQGYAPTGTNNAVNIKAAKR